MAEKKYVVGYAWGQEKVMWEDVSNFSETLDPETGLTVISFEEDGVVYTYKGNNERGFKEVNNLAPSVTELKLMGRRTAKRHDYLNQPRQEAPRGQRYPETNTQRHYLTSCNATGCGGGYGRRLGGCGGYGGSCGGGYGGGC